MDEVKDRRADIVFHALLYFGPWGMIGGTVLGALYGAATGLSVSDSLMAPVLLCGGPFVGALIGVTAGVLDGLVIGGMSCTIFRSDRNQPIYRPLIVALGTLCTGLCAWFWLWTLIQFHDTRLMLPPTVIAALTAGFAAWRFAPEEGPQKKKKRGADAARLHKEG